MTTVTMNDMRAALDSFGIEKNAIILTHSSLKAVGQIEGGAEAVIEAIENTVPDGTVVFPTLSQKNWATAFEDWHMDRPSDVGLITETFRLQKDSLRSDNPTHSVAARGKFAEDIVSGHAVGKPRYGVFGDYCFGHESPWQRMMDSRTRYGVKCYILFWGVATMYSTMKHLAEYRFTERLLDAVKDEQAKAELKLRLKHKPTVTPPEGVVQTWPYYLSMNFEAMLFEKSIARRVNLGDSSLILCDAYDTVTFAEKVLDENPEAIIEYAEAMDWINDARAAAK